MERLSKALIEHTSLSPNSVEGQFIIKDKFITQAAPDIRRKLQKQAIGSERTWENLLKVATSVFYNRHQDEAPKKKRNLERRTKPLVAALQACEVQDPQRTSASCYWCGSPGHFKKKWPGSKTKQTRPWTACGKNHWKWNYFWRQRSLGSEPVSQMVQ